MPDQALSQQNLRFITAEQIGFGFKSSPPLLALGVASEKHWGLFQTIVLMGTCTPENHVKRFSEK